MHGYGGEVTDVLEAKETPPKHWSRKDKRTWCRGRKGKPHIPYWQPEHTTIWERPSEAWFMFGDLELALGCRKETLLCMVCKKVLDANWRSIPDDADLQAGQEISPLLI